MSGHTKEHHTNLKNKKPLYTTITFDFGSSHVVYPNVPASTLKSILEKLSSIKPVEESLKNWKESESFQKLRKDLKGIEEYQESAMAVRGARIRDGLTQKELAKKLKMMPHNLSMIENAKRPVGKELASRLSEFFHVSYKIFLSELKEN